MKYSAVKSHMVYVNDFLQSQEARKLSNKQYKELSDFIYNAHEKIQTIQIDFNTNQGEPHEEFVIKDEIAEQIDAAVNALINIARGNFSVRAPLSNKFENIDALSLAINMLSEELQAMSDTIVTQNQELIESNYFISKVTETISDIILLFFTRNLAILYTNKVLAELTTEKPEKILGKSLLTIFENIHPDDRALFNDMLGKCKYLKKNNKLTFELRIKTNKQAWLWFMIEITPFLFNEDGHTTQAIGKFTNISELKKKEEEIILGNERYKALSESSTDAIIISDASQKIISWNKGAEDTFGYMKEEVIGRPIDIIMPKEFLYQKHNNSKKTQNGDNKISMGLIREIKGRRKNGNIFPIEINIAEWGNKQGKKYYGAVIRDIAERTLIVEELKKLSKVAKQSRHSIIIFDKRGNFEWVNKGFEMTTGYNFTEVLGRNFIEVLRGAQTSVKEVDMITGKMRKREAISGEILYYKKDKSPFWYSYDIVPVFSTNGDFINFIATKIDITYKKKLENELISSNNEKEVMLREIHHRVKNNLQIVNSIFDIQLNRIKDERMHEILQNGKSRIRSISLIHEQLYMQDHLSKIVFSNYLKSLVSSIEVSFMKEDVAIDTSFDLDSIEIDVNTAIPLGLISNELITNAYKHSFNNRANGTIYISFKIVNENLVLSISDNGPGLPDDFNEKAKKSLGYQIIYSLVSQLDAEIDFIVDGGTSVTISKKLV